MTALQSLSGTIDMWLPSMAHRLGHAAAAPTGAHSHIEQMQLECVLPSDRATAECPDPWHGHSHGNTAVDRAGARCPFCRLLYVVHSGLSRVFRLIPSSGSTLMAIGMMDSWLVQHTL